MIRIYALKNKAYKNMDVKPLKDDKWNPGDVWAIANGFNVDSLDTTSVDGLNGDILENFLNRMLVGISLKGPMTKNVPIKELNIENIFNRFYTFREDNEKTLSTHSGLGLHIARQIIEAHKGNIRAENQINEGRVMGAKFIINLPVNNY